MESRFATKSEFLIESEFLLNYGEDVTGRVRKPCNCWSVAPEDAFSICLDIAGILEKFNSLLCQAIYSSFDVEDYEIQDGKGSRLMVWFWVDEQIDVWRLYGEAFRCAVDGQTKDLCIEFMGRVDVIGRKT